MSQGCHADRTRKARVKATSARTTSATGRQLGRVTAAHNEEIVVDRLYPGNAKLTEALRPLVLAAEQTLELDEEKRKHTVLRVDAGGGSLSDVNWMLGRDYHVHCKD